MKIKPGILVLLILVFINISSAQTTISGGFIFEGINRTYRIYVPAIYNSNTAVPLVFNLHGYTSNNIAQEFYGDFRPIADTANFILVHPNGTVDGSGNQFWNAFGGTGVNDVGFISALIDTVSASFNIDYNCIYSTGMSNGGFMSYDLACFLSNRIAAVASVTGSMIWPRLNACNTSHPVPVMQIHGTADATVAYNGSASFVPIDSLVRYWAFKNNCSLTPVITPVPNINTTDGCTAENQLFDGGANGSTVELYKVFGGGHSWPGAPINVNVTNMDFSASKEIWRFFRKYKLNVLTSLNNDVAQSAFTYKIYPNPSSGNFVVEFNEQFSADISILNNLGQIIHQETVAHRINEFELLKPGFYMVMISINGIIRTEKVIRF